ncbi:Hydroxylamine reductase [Candidatus Methylocalor cossyra]|uniref:Hydroxylamine reductase n=2 Tax=Candidatus Methylocalor cossyra TaxID=3108543 RepID=A0ABP1CC39_9GAMM
MAFPKVLSNEAKNMPISKDGTSIAAAEHTLRSSDTPTQGRAVARSPAMEEHCIGLRSLMLWGIEGARAYARQARALGYASDELDAALEGALNRLAEQRNDPEALWRGLLGIGGWNLKVLELLDAARWASFGFPEPTAVRVTPLKGKAILVVGDDLNSLALLLEQTQDKGVQVYTQGELLAAHAYPKLRAYTHLVGNYGDAKFPGPILVTLGGSLGSESGCGRRIFTLEPAECPNAQPIENKDFAPLIEAALALPGFHEDAPAKTITVGFGHHAILDIADRIITAVMAGAVRHFFLIAGSEGSLPGGAYYDELAERLPKDSVVLALGPVRYRFHRRMFGTLGGIPRFLDMGQCYDGYSAMRVLGALAAAFGCNINALPLTVVVSPGEQRAVALLLGFLASGIRNIWLGPAQPAFCTPTLLRELSIRFGLKPVTQPDSDLAAIPNPQSDGLFSKDQEKPEFYPGTLRSTGILGLRMGRSKSTSIGQHDKTQEQIPRRRFSFASLRSLQSFVGL